MMHRVSISNHNYGYIGHFRVKHPCGRMAKPWRVWQQRGGNRSFATFAEAWAFVDGGVWE